MEERCSYHGTPSRYGTLHGEAMAMLQSQRKEGRKIRVKLLKVLIGIRGSENGMAGIPGLR